MQTLFASIGLLYLHLVMAVRRVPDI